MTFANYLWAQRNVISNWCGLRATLRVHVVQTPTGLDVFVVWGADSNVDEAGSVVAFIGQLLQPHIDFGGVEVRNMAGGGAIRAAFVQRTN